MNPTRLCALVLLLPGTALAERPITYREALQGALQANPSLRRTELARDQAEAGVMSASGTFDPTYNLTGFYDTRQGQQFFPGFGAVDFTTDTWSVNNSVSATALTGTTVELSQGLSFNSYELEGAPPDNNYSGDLTASLTQQLLRGLSFKYNLENVTIARRNLEVADLNLEKARQDTLSQAATAYWSWVYQASLAEIQREAVAVAEEALRVGQLKVEAGELAPVEKTRLQAALVQAQANAIDSDNAADKAADDLLLVMGESPDQLTLPATPAGDVPSWELDADKAVEVALQQNLDLVVARASLESAEIERRNANHGRLPSLSATAEVGRTVRNVEDTSTALSYFGDESNPAVMLRGNLSVPILNRAARGQAQARAATVEQRRLELDELERSITAQVEQQARALQSAKRRVELADANLALAEETLRAEEALSEAGRAIQKDVLEARTEVERTRAEAAKARTDYRLAQVELMRLQGQLSADLPQ